MPFYRSIDSKNPKPYLESYNRNSPCSRTTLLCYLTTALGGVWLLEQPSGSVLEYHPSFRQMLLHHFLARGMQCVVTLVVHIYLGFRVQGIYVCIFNLDRVAEYVALCFKQQDTPRSFGVSGGWRNTMHLHLNGTTLGQTPPTSPAWTKASSRSFLGRDLARPR